MNENEIYWDQWFAERQAFSDSIDAAVSAILSGSDRVADDMLAIAERYHANQ